MITDKVHEDARMAAKTLWMINYAQLNDYILWIRPWQIEHQRSINDFWFCIVGNLSCELLHTVINGVLAALIGKMVGSRGANPLWQWASTLHQRYFDMHFGLSEWQCLTIIHIICTGCRLSQNSAGYLRYAIMTMSVNGVSTVFDLVSQVMKMSFGGS